MEFIEDQPYSVGIYNNLTITVTLNRKVNKTAIDIISELYIVDKKYVSKEEYSKKKKVADQPCSSVFSNEYWNELSKYNIPQLGEPIKLLLGNKLVKE